MNTENMLLKDILNNNTLYEVYEDEENKLQYKLEDGEKIKICEINELTWDDTKTLCGDNGVAILSPPKEIEKEIIKNNYNVSFIPLSAVNEVTGKIRDVIIKPYNDVCKGYTFFKEGDILFAKVTPSMENGNCVIAQKVKNKIGFASTELNTIRCKDDYYNKFFWFLLRSEYLKNKAKKTMKGTGGLLRVPSSFFMELLIKVPTQFKIYDSLMLQKSIAKNIEEKSDKIEYKIKTLNLLKILNNLKIENLIKKIFKENTTNNTSLRIDNHKIEINQIIWNNIKLYKENKHGKGLNTKYIAKKKSGFSLKNKISKNNLVNYIKIADLNNNKELFINNINTNYKISQDDVNYENKGESISKGNILVSFKMTIGVTKVYNCNTVSYCNEAIDIIEIINEDDYDIEYITFLIGDEYKKNTQNNVGSVTLNDDLKDLIYLKIPKEIVINGNTIRSIEIQKSISNYLKVEINKIENNNKNINNLKELLEISKENLLKMIG